MGVASQFEPPAAHHAQIPVPVGVNVPSILRHCMERFVKWVHEGFGFGITPDFEFCLCAISRLDSPGPGASVCDLPPGATGIAGRQARKAASATALFFLFPWFAAHVFVHQPASRCVT